MLELNKIYCGDCLERMKELPDKSVDLIISDTPYNIGKDDWDKMPNYIDWIGRVFKGYERILKDNGSFYQFHNDMPTISKLMIWLEENTDFVFKQFIAWNKKFKDVNNEGYLQGYLEVDGLRNYQKMAEYILFYTFQDNDLEQWIYESRKNIALYLRNEINKSGLTQNDIRQKMHLNMKGGGLIPHWIGIKQPSLIPKHQYEKMQDVLQNINSELLLREWADIKNEYEKARNENNTLRYTFNNQKTHHSVWNYEIAERCNHETPKPTELIKNIISHSSNEGDLVFDGFMGSGTTAVACIRTGRNFIGFEISSEYCKIANERIRKEYENQKGQLFNPITYRERSKKSPSLF